MSLSQIKQDLRDIRYYYSRKDVFEKASANVGTIVFEETVSKYNAAIRNASPRLYDLYVSLYLENNTQESLSDKLGYTFEYVSRLNKDLMRFFEKQFKEGCVSA